jgi:hypothetical protein
VASAVSGIGREERQLAEPRLARLVVAGEALLELEGGLDVRRQVRVRRLGVADAGRRLLVGVGAGRDQAGRAAGEIDEVLEGDEAAERVPEQRVLAERRHELLQRAGVRRERPLLRVGRAPVARQVDQQQPVIRRQRLGAGQEDRAVEARAGVEEHHRVPLPQLTDVEPGQWSFPPGGRKGH